MPRTSTSVIASIAAASLALLAGCGDDASTNGDDASTDDADVSGEVPTPDITAFTGGDFDDIELPAGADEAGDKTERDGVISQSYFAASQSPETVMEHFADSLALQGWDIVEPVSSRGTDSLAAAWAAPDGRRLEISAVLAQGAENERTQFSVVLLPSAEPGEEITGG